jgi:glucosamine-6-phosphate deaminase
VLSRPTLPITVVATAEAAGELVAADLLSEIALRDGRYLLGCPAGRTPVAVFESLGRLATARDADLSNVELVMMDEYVLGSIEQPRLCDGDAHFSCRRFVTTDLLPLVNRGLPPAQQLSPARVHFPDPADPAGYDRWIDAMNGVDHFLLASGVSDGHVAFNPPGSSLDAPTRILSLAETTRRDNLATFPQFQNLDEVPVLGISIGLRSIARSKSATLLLLGAHKSHSFKRVVARDTFDSEWPATVIHACRRARLVADADAAGSSRQ